MERHKIIAIILAVLFVVISTGALMLSAIDEGEAPLNKDILETAFFMIVLFGFCLTFILWGDVMGQWTDYFVDGWRYISQPSPGWLVQLMGWILLVLIGSFSLFFSIMAYLSD